MFDNDDDASNGLQSQNRKKGENQSPASVNLSRRPNNSQPLGIRSSVFSFQVSGLQE
jgi:hypothetical protein